MAAIGLNDSPNRKGRPRPCVNSSRMETSCTIPRITRLGLPYLFRRCVTMSHAGKDSPSSTVLNSAVETATSAHRRRDIDSVTLRRLPSFLPSPQDDYLVPHKTLRFPRSFGQATRHPFDKYPNTGRSAPLVGSAACIIPVQFRLGANQRRHGESPRDRRGHVPRVYDCPPPMRYLIGRVNDLRTIYG